MYQTFNCDSCASIMERIVKGSKSENNVCLKEPLNGCIIINCRRAFNGLLYISRCYGARCLILHQACCIRSIYVVVEILQCPPGRRFMVSRIIDLFPFRFTISFLFTFFFCGRRIFVVDNFRLKIAVFFSSHFFLPRSKNLSLPIITFD